RPDPDLGGDRGCQIVRVLAPAADLVLDDVGSEPLLRPGHAGVARGGLAHRAVARVDALRHERTRIIRGSGDTETERAADPVHLHCLDRAALGVLDLHDDLAVLDHGCLDAVVPLHPRVFGHPDAGLLALVQLQLGKTLYFAGVLELLGERYAG